jgi:hypothetical protein
LCTSKSVLPIQLQQFAFIYICLTSLFIVCVLDPRFSVDASDYYLFYKMHAYRNRNSNQHGQIIESQVELLSDVSVDMQDNYYVFKDLQTGENIVRIR